MKTNVYHLKIIPIQSILSHEYYDQRRTKPLVKKLRQEKRIRNPIIVADLGDGKYLQLDGMNRFSVFKMMKIPTIIAQIIDYNDQDSVELSSWVHLFSGNQKNFIQYIKKADQLIVKSGRMEYIGHRYIKEEGSGRLCSIVTKGKKVFLVSANGSLIEKIEKINQIVKYYRKKIVRDVLPLNFSGLDIENLFIQHPPCNIMVIFPTFTRHQILKVVRKGGLFPPGVTRHIIKRRCLHVNLPLSLFTSDKSLDLQNQELEKRLKNRPFRFYEEPDPWKK